MTTLPRLAALALLAGLAAACSSGSGGGYVAAGAKQAQAAPLTVEQLSAKVGCEPRMQVDAADIRTGYCKTADGQFFVTTFTSQAGKDAWMDAAPEYNPHLVGNLWTVLSSRKVLELLKERLGGDLHLKDHRTNKMRTVG
ncbi:MAG: hypothetical protein HOV96_15335 [Nonomuraea sp.]|nr:hypothetical protein [Nonomuraea sp.]NUP64570.1 hypothetical protein [Nonomuraea sp.]NUP78911.1 hypothetical protein [Nonomuraea sp.]NUS09228.1 hypothetical protein [Nonomuraea sp.]NUT42392.1 hypothetical protein [Thermoactinospora sp.]